MQCDLMDAREVSCTGKIYHLAMKVHKAQIRVKTGADMV
jgi:hypothetical protein